MRAYLVDLLSGASTPVQGRNLAREYLQALILSSLQRAGAMISLAFHGGTALRFLYAAQRYSEDLDFALEDKRSRYDFRAYLKAVRSDLDAQGYPVEVKVKDQKTVHSGSVGFPGLLYELALSSHRDEVFTVKIEVDTDPPAGAGLTTTVIRRYVLLNLQHHDRASMLAGKLHAVLQRPYLKGRDVYDLLWYLSDPDWPPPNLTLLNNALQQTGWEGGLLTLDTWHSAVRRRFQGVNWEAVQADVRPFLESRGESDFLNEENLLWTLGG